MREAKGGVGGEMTEVPDGMPVIDAALVRRLLAARFPHWGGPDCAGRTPELRGLAATNENETRG